MEEMKRKRRKWKENVIKRLNVNENERKINIKEN